jgi:hypothetical protein
MKKVFFCPIPALLMICAFYKTGLSPVETVLTSGNWSYMEYQIDENDDGMFENAGLPCEEGDIWHFSADHTFEMRDEVTYCDSDVDSMVVISGTWELRNDDTELYLEVDPDFLHFNFDIQFIDNRDMELRAYNTPESSQPLEERFIFHR